MRIRVEPKEFFMYTVFLAFGKNRPDPEDEAVRAYLADHQLEPKVQGTNTLEGQEFDVMAFGGCYLGKHLGVVQDMQRHAVEREMLSEEVGRALRESVDLELLQPPGSAREARLKELIGVLAEEFHEASSFGADEEGYVKVALDHAVIRQKFMEKAVELVQQG
jgi:hypothetical protein